MKKSALVIIALTSIVGSASAQDFLAVNNLAGTNGYTADGADQLINFNFGTAAWAPVSGDGGIRLASGAPVNGFGGLDYNHATGALYGATAFGANAGNLYQINPSNGQATLLGSTGVPLNDMAWDSVSGMMYGTSGNALYSVSLVNGATNLVGVYSVAGMLEVGLGFDSRGHVHVHDIVTDAIYVGTAPGSTNLALLHGTGSTNFSQGLFVDWTNDTGYHAALNPDTLASPNYTYTLAGGSYTFQSVFGTAGNGLPQVEAGDLTRLIPAPGALAILGLGGLIARRRR